MVSDHHSDEMTQSDHAFLSALKAMILIFLASGIAQPKTFDLYFGPMMQTYAAQGDLKAAELLRLLVAFANDPTHAATLEVRRTIQMLRDIPPAGSA
jgi:hypothetical protein